MAPTRIVGHCTGIAAMAVQWTVVDQARSDEANASLSGDVARGARRAKYRHPLWS